MADDQHENGSMNIDAQEKAFDGFMRWVTNTTIVIIVLLVFLAIFAT